MNYVTLRMCPSSASSDFTAVSNGRTHETIDIPPGTPADDRLLKSDWTRKRAEVGRWHQLEKQCDDEVRNYA